MDSVQIYDTTLRDGTQGEGISLSVEDKVKIARRLDEMGISYIEGGWPGLHSKGLTVLRARSRTAPLARQANCIRQYSPAGRPDTGCYPDVHPRRRYRHRGFIRQELETARRPGVADHSLRKTCV